MNMRTYFNFEYVVCQSHVGSELKTNFCFFFLQIVVLNSLKLHVASVNLMLNSNAVFFNLFWFAAPLRSLKKFGGTPNWF